jgi:hypothetical protein
VLDGVRRKAGFQLDFYLMLSVHVRIKGNLQK